MTTERYIKLGRQTALISFLLGTALFSLYFLTSLGGLLFIGYWFIIVIGIINIGILSTILIRAVNDKGNRKKLLITCIMMIMNIPAMLLYSWITIILLNTMRITFINLTNTTVTDINIIGCETEYIDKLEMNESRTVWVAITNDCSIEIDYLSNGNRKEESVVGYATANTGEKMEYRIVGK